VIGERLLLWPARFLESIRSDASRRDRFLAGLVLAWVLGLFAAFQPGLMSWDSLQQYEQGLSGSYHNWHPPIVSLLNGIAGRLAGSPWPLLVAQLLAIGFGMLILVRRAPATRALPALALLCGFMAAPPVWSIAVTLWKDALVGAALLGAVAAVDSRRPFLALGLTVLGTLCRHNAVVAALPLAMAAASHVVHRHRDRLIAAVAVLAVLGFAPKLAERALDARDEWPLGALLVFDEIGVYSTRPDLLAASPLHRDFTVADLKHVYTPASQQPIFTGGPEATRITAASLPPRREQIRAEWFRVVRAAPLAYARHRLLHFRSLLGADGNPVCYPFHVGIDPGNPWGFRVPEGGAIHRALRHLQETTRNSFLFRGWFWMLALLALAAAASWRRAPRLAVWTAASGLLYGAAYLVVGVVCDFRFLYWSVLASFATGALLLRSDRVADAGLLERS